jgi:DNA (cytosine-5)-methyltransferase 1
MYKQFWSIRVPRPIGIDLFAGAGGLSLGFEQAGFDIKAAVELDPIHCAVHQFNFPECAIVAGSVSHLSGADIRMRAGLGRRRIDVVFGGAPCQGFSLIGHRALDDPRNRLVRDFVRLVAELNASYFVFENVKGLTVGRHRQFLEEVIAAFQSAGYQVQRPWRVLDAAEYGVPQHRERLILMGAKQGLPLPAYPEAICSPADGVEAARLPWGPTCREALGDLPEPEDYDELANVDQVVARAWGDPGSYAREMRCLGRRTWQYGYPRRWNRRVLTSSLRTEHTVISRRRFARTAPGEVEAISRFYRLPADGLSNTLRAGTDSSRGAFTSPRPIHYEKPRCITVREMARLQGFPDWFRLHSTKWHGARQVGNAVPPPLARAVAAQVMRAMGVNPEIPAETISLGDPALLRMDMSRAAEHFGIAVPIGKRDRKSGAKKRKQHEIEAEVELAFDFNGIPIAVA